MPKKTTKKVANKLRPKKTSPKITKTKKLAAQASKVVSYVKLPSALYIAREAWLIMWKHRATFCLVVLIYGLAYLILVLGLSAPANVNGLRSDLAGAFHGHFSSLYTSLSIFTYLIGTSISSSAGSSAYQIFILIAASLSIIWTLRQLYLGKLVRARDGYYKGLYPLAQYVLILTFIAIELIPLAIGFALYALLVNSSNTIAVNTFEKVISTLISMGFIFVSCYLVSSSIISLYIVTLPDMTPMKALRSAKNLVKGRRWQVFRKMFFLPIMLLIVAAIIMLPFIFIIPVITPWIFFIFTLLALAYTHSYLYNLYRGLINEQISSQ